MIRLEDFPRPKDDNGRGIHWSPSPYHLSGSELDPWLDELQAMGIKWVKVMDDGGGSSLELCQRLVDLDIMPVVRLYIGNPGHIQIRNLEAIRRLMDVGAMYFETNNEPDLAVEWENGIVPPNWLEIVVDNFIIDATEIIALGGHPAFPAMGVGTIVNPFQLVVDRGRQDLFDNGAWLAIHNYVINHPLDYPYDPVNQTGEPLTEAEYEANRWGWDDDPLSVINRLRREGAQPGVTLYDDATCWLAYALWNEQVVQAFGHPVPIMSTEGGVVIGDRQDGRYPRNDVRRHEEVTLWIQDFLLTSAPTWYFTVFHWLIANNRMAQNRPGWETQCWYTHWWDKEFGLNGHLPTVDALKRTPPHIRRDATADAVIQGHLQGNPGQPANRRRIRAWKNGTVARETESREDGFYRFVGLPEGTYAITADGVQGLLAHGLTLVPHSRLRQDIRLPGPSSAIGGQVTGTDGAARSMQTLVIHQDGRQIASTVTNWQGYYVFANLAAGTYQVELPGQPLKPVNLDGVRPATVDFVVPAGQEYALKLVTRRLLTPGENRGRHTFFGFVRDEVGGPIDGVTIEMSWAGADHGTVFPTTASGNDGGKPPGYFEFIHTKGEFTLRLLDVPWPADVAGGLKTTGLPGQLPDQSVSYEIVWQLAQKGSQPSRSIVTGTIIGGREGLTVILKSEVLNVSALLRADGSFRFESLPAGRYDLEVTGAGTVAQDIQVDGTSVVNLLPIDITSIRQGVIQGTVSDLQGIGRPDVAVILWFGEEQLKQTRTNDLGDYRFELLLPGLYAIETVDPPAKSSEVLVSAGRPVTVDLRISGPEIRPEPIDHYLLFGPLSAPGTRANFRAARKYIIESGSSAGFDAGEAFHARQVTIIGEAESVSPETENRLREAGCIVGRLTGDTYTIADALSRLPERTEL